MYFYLTFFFYHFPLQSYRFNQFCENMMHFFLSIDGFPSQVYKLGKIKKNQL